MLGAEWMLNLAEKKLQSIYLQAKTFKSKTKAHLTLYKS